MHKSDLGALLYIIMVIFAVIGPSLFILFSPCIIPFLRQNISNIAKTGN